VNSSLGPTRNTSTDKPLVPRQWMLLFVLVTVLFYLWGAANNLNDVLIRQFMKCFELGRMQAGLVQSAFYLGYFFLAIPAALLMRRYGYKAGMVTGLLLFGTGTLLFWPAANVGRYSFFLLALFVIGSGLSFLETASNPFVAELGDLETSERRLNLAQSFNPLGNITGVLVGTIFIFSGVEKSADQILQMKAAGTYFAYAHGETLRVVPVYIVVSVVVFLWAALLGRAKFPTIASEHEGTAADHGSFGELVNYPHFQLAVVGIFLYVGAQVCTWSYFIQYVEQYTGLHEKDAGYMLTANLCVFMVGRFVATWLMQHFRPNKLMAAYAVANIVLCAVGILLPGWTGMIAVLLTSFFMSLMFPTIFALGIKGLGPNTKVAGALLVMGIVGGALITPLMGWLTQSTTLALSFIIPLVCYVYIWYYSVSGCMVPVRHGVYDSREHVPRIKPSLKK
jgi:FHS family L-fucose permease-like MFS transporter